MRITLSVVALIIAVAAPATITGQVNANRYDAQISALEREVERYQSTASTLGSKADSLQKQLDIINNDIRRLQSEISLTKVQYDKLVAEITATEQKIDDNRDALGSVIADMSVDGSISPIEMLASSNNISDYIDKQTYQSSMRDALKTTIAKIKQLKADLESKKAETEKVMDRQRNTRQELGAKQSQQSKLVAETRNQEGAYKKLAAKSKARLAAVHAEQQAALDRITRGGSNNAGAVGAFQFRNFSGNQGCGGGYPYCGPQDSMVDPWALYNRECVSYSAWRAVQMGKRVGNFSGQGNAYQWPASASGWMGADVNNTPAVGAVAILPITPGFAPIGHSMNVEAILGGGWVRVSQYNFGGTGQYSTMDIKASGVVFLHFPNQ